MHYAVTVNHQIHSLAYEPTFNDHQDEETINNIYSFIRSVSEFIGITPKEFIDELTKKEDARLSKTAPRDK